jgi:fumarylacetoacetase
MTDPTIDPALRSWVPVDRDSDFPIQNLPFGVFSSAGRSPRVGVGIGGAIVDVSALANAGVFDDASLPVGVFSAVTLNPFLELGKSAWDSVRRDLSSLLADTPQRPSLSPEAFLVPMADAQMHLPVDVGDYVDFYSSLEHATNVGRLFRPDQPPLLPNWRHLPIGYHGRSSSIVVDGTPIVRPSGQRKPPDGDPVFGPTRRLDIELEVGFITGKGGALGVPISVDDAEDHIFGLVLVNDWSARDIQAWEYRPLGPFLGKSFATSISPWVVPLQALAPYRVTAPAQDPPALPYLTIEPNRGIDMNLTVDLNGTTITTTNFRHMYWTMAQQLAHATANGTNVRAGDLFASGTVSGPEATALGSLLEMTRNGVEPIRLDDGTNRTFLEDADRITLRGWCTSDGAPRIGFGRCLGVVAAAGSGPTSS